MKIPQTQIMLLIIVLIQIQEGKIFSPTLPEFTLLLNKHLLKISATIARYTLGMVKNGLSALGKN